jgi:hypothetical protein
MNLAITWLSKVHFQVNNVSQTAKSSSRVPDELPQSPGSLTDRPVSSLERTAGWLRRLVAKPSTRSESPIIKDLDIEGDPLLAFASEDAAVSTDPQPLAPADVTPARTSLPRPVVQLPRASTVTGMKMSGIALVTAVGVLIGVSLRIVGTLYPGDLVGATAAEFGTFAVETEPAGADVLIDGQSRGFSPLRLSLPPGPHNVVVRHGAEERRVPLTLAAGAEVVHHVAFSPVKAAPIVGSISVVTDPPGARVLIDGQTRGASPVTVTDLAAAEHKVSVSSEAGAADRTVAVRAGETVSVVFSLPRVSGPLAGWAVVSSPFDVQVLQDNNIVGSGRSAKIMVPAGKHTFAIVNQTLGYQDTRTVDVAAGRTSTIQVNAPQVVLNVNARPWADVFIDGKSVGQTPIGNLSLAIGTYELAFRHPDFGERRQTVTLTTKGTNRVAVDLTK